MAAHGANAPLPVRSSPPVGDHCSANTGAVCPANTSAGELTDRGSPVADSGSSMPDSDHILARPS